MTRSLPSGPARGEARLQHADGRRGEALQPSDVVGKHGVNFAAGDDGADEGGGPHAIHAQQPGAVEARRQAQPLPECTQPLLRTREAMRPTRQRQQLKHERCELRVEAREMLRGEGGGNNLGEEVQRLHAALAQQ